MITSMKPMVMPIAIRQLVATRGADAAAVAAGGATRVTARL